jgi:hypothetical protein
VRLGFCIGHGWSIAGAEGWPHGRVSGRSERPTRSRLKPAPQLAGRSARPLKRRAHTLLIPFAAPRIRYYHFEGRPSGVILSPKGNELTNEYMITEAPPLTWQLTS